MHVQPENRYRLAKGVRFRVIDSEGIFVLQEAGEVLAVNRVAAFVVNNLREDHTLAEVTEAVTAQFAVDAARARQDIEAVIQQLVDAGALASA